MTPGTLTPFEKGKSYKPFVLFVSKSDPLYLNVRMEDGSCFKVEVSGTPAIDVRKLKDKSVDLVCTEVTDKGPEFALAPRYYAPPAPAAFTSSGDGGASRKPSRRVYFCVPPMPSPPPRQLHSR